MVGQAQVIVAGQVDHLAAVVVANWGLLVVENPELEVGTFGAEFVENGGKVSELWARSLSHGVAPQRESITPPAGLGRTLHSCRPASNLGWGIVLAFG